MNLKKQQLIFIFLDWPDYTSSESDTESEVETIIGGKDGIHVENENEHVPMDSVTPTEELVNHTNNSHIENLDNTDHHKAPVTRSRTHSKHEEVHEEVTAHKILNLLSEIGHSSFVDNMSFMEKQFHPCKYCKGRLQIL